MDLKQKISKAVPKTTSDRRNFNNLLPFEDGCRSINNQSIGVRIDELCNYKSFSQSCNSSKGEIIDVSQWCVSKYRAYRTLCSNFQLLHDLMLSISGQIFVKTTHIGLTETDASQKQMN